MDYSQTLNLPKTDFPMKANLAGREPEFQAFWEQIGLYEKSLERPAPKGSFVLHDGPPYSNGHIHMGHALNKILKDFIVKFKGMDGYRSPYIPGWDNHGMPIEKEVATEFLKKKQTASRLELRTRCREYAAEWVDIQRREFRRLGVRGDWEHPYLTMSPDYEAKIVEVFADLAKAGFIYRGLKPVLWCPRDETALAEAEIEYDEQHVSHSIYVRFPLLEDPNGVFPAGSGNNYTIIWTTTPWTIPANLAVAVHPDYTYAVVEAGQNTYLLVEGLVKATMEAVGVSDYRVVSTRPGRELMGLKFRHPLFDRPSPVVTARYVTLENGTGVVHTAPGHGREDFMTGQEFGLEILSPVDASGHFTEEAGPFAGLDLKAGNQAVIDRLREAGALLAEGTVTHSYPHCWRCHGPVIFRATRQWFMNIDHEGFREKALAAIQQVGWYPSESINRITSMVGGRPDWCLSRQRAWGVGIPAFYCKGCDGEVLTPESLAAVHRLVKAEGSDAWYTRPAAEILPAGFTCPGCGGTTFEKETDILDVWFDSGSSCRAVLEERPELSYPADVYLEGSDQHRGWFNSSLMVGMGTRGAPPYRAVITNGWMLDEAGRAQHKSWGNAIPPEQVVGREGADVLRLWVASVNYFEDVRQGPNILKQVSDAYRRIRNTFRYLLSNLYDFDPARDTVPHGSLLEIDRWALHRLGELVARVREGYESYEFHRVYHAVHNFCAIDLSAFYLDVLKDRLYASVSEAPERRSAQTVLYALAETLARLMAPILSHTCEEVWQHLPAGERPESVQLADFPAPPAEWRDAAVAARWDGLLAVRDAVNKAMEEAKEAGTVKKPQAARVIVSAPADRYRLLREYEDQLAKIFVVSQTALRNGEQSEVSVAVEPAPGERCDRCWLVLPTVGVDPAHPTLCDRCAAAVTAQS
jgi:isoleucyl-tRNA synthetase